MPEIYYLSTFLLDWASNFVNIHFLILVDRNAQSQGSLMQRTKRSSTRLIQALGGKIWVESEQGAGSKFCFLLPLRPAGVPAGGAR